MNEDYFNAAALASSNSETRKDYQDQLKHLTLLLDRFVYFSDTDPPTSTKFEEQEALLECVTFNQNTQPITLRDLHAQKSNLGVAEKLLNEELGQHEWLSEVDLERLLVKLGLKNKTHITRLNPEDIGMILHFERIKHQDSADPYTIPLLINRGASGSIRDQGSHWTYALVTVNPAIQAVHIAYQDSMPLDETEQETLTAGLNYHDGDYSAFSGFVTKTVAVVSDGLQRDGWSCGYRALRGLISTLAPPADDDPLMIQYWQKLLDAGMESEALREVVYEILLSGLIIDPDYFVAMKLDRQMIIKSSDQEQAYELDDAYTKRYLELLATARKPQAVITTNRFKNEYEQIIKLVKPFTLATDRKDSVQRLEKGIDNIQKNELMSFDAKMVALLDLFANEYALILKQTGGNGSRLARYLHDLCEKNFGVRLNKPPNELFILDGLMNDIITHLIQLTDSQAEPTSILPPRPQRAASELLPRTAPPDISRTGTLVSHSAPISSAAAAEIGQQGLRKADDLSRLGSMFGLTQFCYAEKPSGVEPGFRAIDLNELFFKNLIQILARASVESIEQLPLEEQEKLSRLRDELNKGDLRYKQRLFTSFINAHVKKPHPKGVIPRGIEWLCGEIKAAVDESEHLSAWMYKLDYAPGGERKRVKTNMAALREYTGTYLAGIFSSHNQKQEIVWVNEGGKSHALLACGWKSGLRTLEGHLYGGQGPDFNGILVEDPEAPVKRSKHIPGLVMNLIFGLAIGDRDGIGRDAQNKGIVDGIFYGFDYGKPYEGDGVCQTINDDFTFDDKYAKAPKFLRSDRFFGLARHGMYRNYSVFYDSDLSERMFGLHLFRKMITGENPSEDVIKSFPGLRQELHRIQESTPDPKDLLGQLHELRKKSTHNAQLATLIDTYTLQICSGRFSNFDLYFAKIKIDLIEMAIKNKQPFAEFKTYHDFINEMEATARKSNERIVTTFEQRALLTKQELDLIDHLEKYFSPTSAMSPDGKVFLLTLRFDPPNLRIPFQLKREEDGTYTLSTTDKAIAQQLKDEFGLNCIESTTGLNCTIKQEQLAQLMTDSQVKYTQKREHLLIKPTFKHEVLVRVASLINGACEDKTNEATCLYLWRKDHSLSIRISAKTEEQALRAQTLLGVLPAVGIEQTIEIPYDQLKALEATVSKAFEDSQEHNKAGRQDSTQIALSGLQRPRESVHGVGAIDLQLTSEEELIGRFKGLLKKENAPLLQEIADQINDAAPEDIEQLMEYNDETLSSPENLKAIQEGRFDAVRIISKATQPDTAATDELTYVGLRSNLS